MSVTIKQISELCGVSRGTVDRVLNNRGKVRPETEQKVREVAERLGYTPNMAGKALAARKRDLVIGVALVAKGNAFFDDVLSGIRQAGRELADYGVRVSVHTMKGYDVSQQCRMIREVGRGVHALIVNPINDPQVAAEIDALTESGVCVITVNTDIENTRRLCYVGSDYIRGGETAGGMLGLLTGGKANVGIVTGSVKVLGHNQRIAGFRNVIRRKYPGIRVADIQETNDDDDQAFEMTGKMLRIQPEIDTIFIVAAGVMGVCRAVRNFRPQSNMAIVCFDKTPSSEQLLRAGMVKAIICQQPFTQGNKAVHLAYDYLVSGKKPEHDSFFMKSEIKIEENL